MIRDTARDTNVLRRVAATGRELVRVLLRVFDVLAGPAGDELGDKVRDKPARFFWRRE
jgi:hypothetical protein